MFPLISEYIEAIKSAEDSFKELTYLRPLFDDDGQPVMTSGNFAVVFKMEDVQNGKFYAVKCFTKEQEGRAEAYREIAKELKDVSSPYLVSFQYLEKELFVDTSQTTETEFPILQMDWMEGKTLDKYLRENLDDKYALEMLAYRFSQLAQWLIAQPFAHGDLKPDNIIVRENGTLVLVDYDGMYVPAMKGQKARELGSPDFRPPQRTEDDFDEHIDDFSLASILLSLKTISLQPGLLEEYGASNRLLFSENDYRNLSECKTLNALRSLMQNSELVFLYSLFILATSQKNLSQINLFRLENPQYTEKNLSIEVTEEDLANAWTGENDVKYSADKLRLLKGNNNSLKKYVIKEGTKVICNGAFFGAHMLKEIVIPDGVISIGSTAFTECYALKEIIIPSSVCYIGKNPFCGLGCKIVCLSEKYKVAITENSEKHKYYSLYTKDMKTIIHCGHSDVIWYSPAGYDSDPCSGNDMLFVIPNSVEKIASCSFMLADLYQTIVIPNSVRTIEKYAFWDCHLESITLPKHVDIDAEAFITKDLRCNRVVQKIYVPKESLDYYYSKLPYDKERIFELD